MADEAQLKVRLLRSLKAKVDAAAHENRRTLNAEIVARLERTFIEDEERTKGSAFVRTVQAAEAHQGSADTEARLANLETGLAALLGAVADLNNRISQSIGEQ